MSDKILAALTHKQWASYANFAGTALLIYDFLLTIGDEIELVWPTPFTLGKILFLLTRYPPFISAGIIIYHQLASSVSLEACNILYHINAWLYISGILIAEIILLIRTWIIWHKDKRLTIGLPIYSVACWTVIIYAMASFLRSLEFGVIPSLGDKTPSCLVVRANVMLVVDWIVLTGFEAGIVILMLIVGYRAYKLHGNTGLVRVVYRDGIIYYILIFTFSIINSVVILSLSNDLVFFFAALERMIHSILTARLLLNLRRQLGRDVVHHGAYRSDVLTTRLDSIDFAEHGTECEGCTFSSPE